MCMIIGVPKEIKNNEFRVGLTPESVSLLTQQGHSVVLEHNAGKGIYASDESYIQAGAKIVTTAEEVFSTAEMIVKVKEPQPQECTMLREGQILFTYLHLAPDPKQTELLIKSKAVCIAYETITDNEGGLPLLKPMSQVAGRIAIQAGAYSLEKSHHGRGVLLGGVSGVAPGKVLIIGGGIVGFNAAQMAVGLGAEVVILDKNNAVIESLHNYFGNKAKVLHANNKTLVAQLQNADLVIGAVLIPGAAAPKIITQDMLSVMKEGSVLVDVAIDQGGCFETSKPTTHAEPTYSVDGVIHYCVANMPGATPLTATYALNNATIEHVLNIANNGWEHAVKHNVHLKQGVNIYQSHVTYEPVAAELGYEYTPIDTLLSD